ncbi:putative disease resistance protein At3g14460 [Lolium perenne]|uniref:putative disease resistance protein At3g14460 n=1 Tax=Lolium perenne TaxID=4522 RepID=UPI003A9A3E1D
MITEEISDGVVVLPIVGIAGVGKTTLAQLVYNDTNAQFDQRIWVWVSHNFDEVRLTRDILDSFSGERHPEINCFAKLQEMLRSYANSKRFLLILDNVWDGMNKVLAPLVSSHVNGNVILVTTRNMSVAQSLGTLKPVKLDALANDDFWLLFKSHAFGYENYDEHQSISNIGRKIAEKLRGSPLAAVSTGDLLRKKLNTAHWRDILTNEDWKSMQLSRGIMSALKLSYDQLPYHLQLCFSYCSIFPYSYQFLGEELVSFWIAQRFVKCNNSSQSVQGIGRCYLIDLVNLGFLQEVKREESYLGSQTLYALCGIMYDFAMMVSKVDCASIDGLQCNKMPQTLRHLSIVTESAYNKDLAGNIPGNKNFEENLRSVVISVRKLRTLVLLGHYDSCFLLLFQEIFQNAHNLRVLHMSATSTDFLKRGYDEVDGAIPQVLSKLYHLQVLNVGSYTDPTIYNQINNLVSLQHLIVHKGVYSSIGSIAAFQEPDGYKFQISSGFEIAQLQSTDEFVQHWMHVKTLEEACEAVLRNCELSEKLILFCKETYADIGMELVCPHPGIKDLQISGLFSNTFAAFQTVHIGGCAEWRILPSLGRFPFLTKLKLSGLVEIKEVLVPSLEELVLDRMPKLEICSCTSVEGLNTRLRALQIEECKALKEFDLFESGDKFRMEQRPWLPGLRELVLSDCPHLSVSKPLPPSTISCELHISGVSILPSMKGLSSEKLYIGNLSEEEDLEDEIDVPSNDLTILNDQILAFDNLRNLKSMRIAGCRNLMSFSLEGFSHLVSLKSLEISMCSQLFCSDMMSDATLEDLTAANWKAFPCLESLSIESSGIGGKWLSLLLRHAPDLEELYLAGIYDLSSGEEDDALTGLAQEGLVHIPLNLTSSLKKLTCKVCRHLTFNCSEEGFSGFTSLQELIISWGCAELFSCLLHKDGNDLTSLKELVIEWSPGLESLQLHSCTALEELTIKYCGGLTTLEGMESLGRLRHLAVSSCPGLGPCLEGFSRQGCELFPQLETLETDDPSVLTMSFCNHLTSLQELKINHCPILLLDLPARLHLLTSLKRLKLYNCRGILRLPETGLPLSLEELEIEHCSKELADQCTRLETSKLRVKNFRCW